MSIVALILVGLSSVHAQLVLSGSGNSPLTPGADWIFYNTGFNDGVLNGGLDFTDNSVPPGQSFTTGATAGLQLDALTFVRANSNFGGGPTELRLNFGTLSGTTFTSIYEGTTTFDTSVVTNNLYLTFSGFTPIALNPNTTYGFVIGRSGGGGWIGWAKNYSPDTDGFAGGQVFNGPGSGSGTSAFDLLSFA